jgi:hypothetical protein
MSHSLNRTLFPKLPKTLFPRLQHLGLGNDSEFLLAEEHQSNIW